MNRTITGLAAVTVLAGVASGADTAMTTDERVAELTDLVSQMRDEIRELRSEQDPEWLTEQRAEEIRGLVHDVLADADTRASLLQSGMYAGYDGGFVINSEDGNFQARLNAQIQTRYTYNSRDAADTSVSGFEARRTKVKLAGHVIDPSWEWAIIYAGANTDGLAGLEDAYVRKDFGNGWTVAMGQSKLPFLREELISSTRQLAVERSLVNEQFNQDFSQGVQVGYETDAFRLKLAFSDGFASRNTRGIDRQTSEFAFTGRAEFLAAGTWKQFKTFSAAPGAETGLMLGAAAHYDKEDYGQRFSAGPPATGDDDEQERFTWTVDASLQLDGASFYAAFIGNHLDGASGNNAGPGGAKVDQYGLVVQGSFFVSDRSELFARYEWGDEDTTAADVDDLSVITVGINTYYNKHVKSTLDVGYALDDISSTWSANSAGWRTDGSPTDDGQIVVRGQVQLVF